MAKLVILGAGLTGLSAAYHLEQAGHFDYLIFEKNDRPGGLLRSFQQDGFTFDFTGHYLHINNNYFRTFLDATVGIHNLDSITRKAAIYSHGVFCNYPFQMNLHGLPLEVIYECMDGYLKRKTSLKTPQSFYAWVLKYFGTGIGKHFFFPYNRKLLAYDLHKIVASWTGRFVPQTNFKAILTGALQPTDQHVGYNSLFYYPKSGGIEFLIKKMASSLKNKVKTNHEAISIDLSKKTVLFSNGHQESFDQLITTMPLNLFLKRVAQNARTPFKHLGEKLLCNTVINFNLGFKQHELLDKHWIYFPEKEYPFYRLGFWHNISKASVKKNCSALYGEIAYLPGSVSEKQIENLTNKAIKKTLNFLHLNNSMIVTEKILKLDHAYVIYDHWREKQLPVLLGHLKSYNVHSVGRFGGWNYSSMQEAVGYGKEIAEQLLEKIGEHTLVLKTDQKEFGKI